MRIYNVHYGMNGEEHDYVIEAMSVADALDYCWYENAFREDGEETYIALWIEELPDCEENRNLCRRIWGVMIMLKLLTIVLIAILINVCISD